jgi:hypothetical protein
MSRRYWGVFTKSGQLITSHDAQGDDRVVEVHDRKHLAIGGAFADEYVAEVRIERVGKLQSAAPAYKTRTKQRRALQGGAK